MPAIKLAMECMRQGGVKELLYLIADDIAVKLFLNNQLRFDQIVPFVEEQVNKKMEDIELEPSTIVPYYYRLKEEIKRQLSC
jgi:1-deoxy-D-xylulose 5-phosphate reductoisomerase